ncbi:MAG: GerMN domain-containing protein [Desulfatitalea sp.]
MGRPSRLLTKMIPVGVAVAVAIFAGWWIARQLAEAPQAQVSVSEQGPSAGPPAKRAVHLYFGDSQGRHLVAEQRVVEQPADDIALARLLIELLIRGPNKEGQRTLPADAHLRALYVTGTGTAYIDFEDDAFAGHPGGVGGELLSIYSMVNTLVLNVEKIRSVKFLIGGHEAATLVGHADLQEPFAVDMMWVR